MLEGTGRENKIAGFVLKIMALGAKQGVQLFHRLARKVFQGCKNKTAVIGPNNRRRNCSNSRRVLAFGDLKNRSDVTPIIMVKNDFIDRAMGYGYWL